VEEAGYTTLGGEVGFMDFKNREIVKREKTQQGEATGARIWMWYGI